jgi:hypothetical protein
MNLRFFGLSLPGGMKANRLIAAAPTAAVAKNFLMCNSGFKRSNYERNSFTYVATVQIFDNCAVPFGSIP